MKDDLGSVWGPTKRLQKKIEKKKSKVKSREIMPTAIHTHGSLHAMTAANSKNQPDGQSPAHTNSMQKINKSQFRTCKLQKHSPGTGTETCKQAGEESCRKFKAKQQMSQPACQASSQETKQPGRSAHAGSQANNQQARDKKRTSNATSQRASQHASQAARPPASKAATQAASQPDRSKNQQNRKAERHTETAIHTAKQGLCWPNCLVTPHRFQKGILLHNHWVRNASHA